MSVETLKAPIGAMPPVSRLRVSQRAKLLALAFLVLVLTSLASPGGGFIITPVFFFLRNRLHLSTEGIATFNLLAGAPLYVSFLFGLVRDRWSPFGWGDKGHYIVFGVAAAAAFGVIAFLPLSSGALLAAMIILTALVLVPLSAANALFSELGQSHAMTGQSGTVLAAATFVPPTIAYLLGGVLSGALEGRNALLAARALFGLGAAIMAAVVLFGLLAPRELTRGPTAPRRRIGAEVAALFRTRSAWPPILIMFLWDFAPAFGVVMQMHMATDLHASDAQVGAFYAIFNGANIPAIILYGWLAPRVRLKTLLTWAAVVGVPSMLPLLLARSAQGEIWAALVVGLMSGFSIAAFCHLAVVSCPRALEGTMMSLAMVTAFFVAQRFGDVFGAWLYQRNGGFVTTEIVTTLVYALVVPVLFLVPRQILQSEDGEADPRATAP
ncbi:MAG TPA: MFS transporter [Caulobacteraceae bacterium]|nr:MFS transporter [Caulobacteraceae bacterium]